MEHRWKWSWSHAIAPQLKSLLVKPKLRAAKIYWMRLIYARNRPGVVAISMSWGGAEFSDEVKLDSHFLTVREKLLFFASSGDKRQRR